MAWSETMFIIQHFYNVFEIDERLTDLEHRVPLIAKSVDGVPEGAVMENLVPGTLWFIVDDNDELNIKSLTILDDDGVFAEPIPFGGSGGGSTEQNFKVELNDADNNTYTLMIVNKNYDLELNDTGDYTLILH